MLTPLTGELIAACCPPEKRETVSALLAERCSTVLPGVGSAPEWQSLIERIQLAALRGSDWDLEKIGRAVALANYDWRDLLVSGGFASDLGAHVRWQQQALQAGRV